MKIASALDRSASCVARARGTREEPNWICCQLGAREHYSIPRALASQARLEALLTDTWVRPGSAAAMAPVAPWRDRFHPGVPSSKVHAWTFRTAVLELGLRCWRVHGWDAILERNRWFQAQTLQWLREFAAREPPVFFSYSYTAAAAFRHARNEGWRTVLGQIDPGPVHESIVLGLHQRLGAALHSPAVAPPAYWENWREEVVLADRIVVNSSWSRDALVGEGVPSERIHVLPLAYSAPPSSEDFQRTYPRQFDRARPLRVLFLGQITLAKGMALLFEVLPKLAREPVEFWFVGPVGCAVPPRLANQANVQWFGAVPRSRAVEFYRDADVFLFPTFSDGFGLTQLEAQAWKLPVIASRFCGEVVEDGRNGLLLEELSVDAICDAIQRCLREPDLLPALSAYSGISDRFSLPALGSALQSLL